MIVKCGINGEVRPDQEIFVCHHCGMPICQEHGWVVASDDAFATSGAAVSAQPGAIPPLPQKPAVPRLPTPAQRSATNVPRPAMHCRDCADRFHKGAMKRHGWAEPPAVARAAGPVRTP